MYLQLKKKLQLNEEKKTQVLLLKNEYLKKFRYIYSRIYYSSQFRVFSF